MLSRLVREFPLGADLGDRSMEYAMSWKTRWGTVWAAVLLASSACGGGRPGREDDAGAPEAGMSMDGGASEGGADDGGGDAGPQCGNGVVEGDEECDDGNFDNGDGCSVTCLNEPATCGDGTCDMAGGETCLNCVPDCRMHPDCNMCPDEDGDGYRDASCGGDDCSDSNPDIHPGAMEVACNMQDDDCDLATSLADDDCVTHLDQDGDRYCFVGFDMNRDGDCADPGELGGGTDCDDENEFAAPELTEMCLNGFDDNCDGSPDGRDPVCSACACSPAHHRG